MPPLQFYQMIVVPAMAALPRMDSPKARLSLMATSGTESAWTYRIQKPVGYAHGFWQFEKRGACVEVLTNDRTRESAAALVKAAGVAPGLDAVFDAIIDHDLLACQLARLNYWLDLHPLAELGDVDGAYARYLDVWRPGKPSRARFDDCYAQSLPIVSASLNAPPAAA
jgi:hypothetical protein